MDWGQVAPAATVASAIFLIIGGIGGYFFAAGGKNRDVEANTAKIIEVQSSLTSLIEKVEKEASDIRTSNDSRYVTTTGKIEMISAAHADFRAAVPEKYVSKLDLAAMEQRIMSGFEKSVQQMISMVQNALSSNIGANR